MALGRFWNFIDGESWRFGGGVYNETIDCKWICTREIRVWVWVCSHEVCIWVCHGREKNSTQRERQVVLEGERGSR